MSESTDVPDASRPANCGKRTSAGPVTGRLPAVGVVLATYDRPQLMRRALASILEQEYAGEVAVVLVFDRTVPDLSLSSSKPGRSVRVLTNNRSPGLAGARNTGILASDAELIAFCDDDDIWLPDKLRTQVERLGQQPDAEFVTTAMEVVYDGQRSTRLAGRCMVTITDLSRSRMAMLHSSSFLFRRSAMLEGFGLVEEDLPRSMAEDWDLLLRAARRRPIEHVDEPLVRIQWGATSYFNHAWRDKNLAHAWLLERHPEMQRDSIGAGLIYGKLAFGHAAVGDRRIALRFAWRCLRANWREPRAVLAMMAIVGVPASRIQQMLNQRGHGI